MTARPDTKVEIFHRPSLEAYHYASLVDRRVKNRNAQVRYRFVEAREPGQLAPLVTMLRGGRGGSVRLKLYLSILWFAANPPYDVSYPARAWASLLDLDQPETNGARRITDAVAWLGEHNLLRLARRQGRPTRIYLLNDDGTGDPYRPPAKIVEELLDAQTPTNSEELKRNYYLQLPAHFWTNGWLAGLSALGIAMLLALLAEHRDKDIGTELWFSPRLAHQRFGLSEDARTTGFRQLEHVGLVTKRRRPVNRDAFEFARMRNTYTLNPARLLQRIGE